MTARQGEFAFAAPPDWVTLEEARAIAKDRATLIERWRVTSLVRSRRDGRQVLLHRGDLVAQLNARKHFDAAAGKRKKDEGMDAAADGRKRLLDVARRIAVEIARGRPDRTCTADDVQLALVAQGHKPEDLGNAAGSLFSCPQWRFTGDWRASSRVSNHAHQNRVWLLVEGSMGQRGVGGGQVETLGGGEERAPGVGKRLRATGETATPGAVGERLVMAEREPIGRRLRRWCLR